MCPPSNISRRRSHKALLRASKLVLELVFDAGARELVCFGVREPESCQKKRHSRRRTTPDKCLCYYSDILQLCSTRYQVVGSKLRAARKLCNKRGKASVSYMSLT